MTVPLRTAGNQLVALAKGVTSSEGFKDQLTILSAEDASGRRSGRFRWSGTSAPFAHCRESRHQPFADAPDFQQQTGNSISQQAVRDNRRNRDH